VPDIAIKLGKRDVSELSPTDIAIEVLSNFYLYFLGSRQTEKFLGAIVESEFCILMLIYHFVSCRHWNKLTTF